MKMGKKPSVKAVVQYLQGKEIDEVEKVEALKADQGYLPIHSALLSEAMKKLADTEKKEIEEFRVQWEMKGPPPRVWRE
jgi:hypothetical protein